MQPLTSQAIIELIKKWKLNRPLLAQLIGMPLGTFQNKITRPEKYKFSNPELRTLRQILRDYSNAIEDIDQEPT